MGDQRIASAVATITNRADPHTAGSSTLFYYHPDHLQSTHFTTGADATFLQHDEYFPTGEVWFGEQKNNDTRNTQPWLFNAKELDETGLYYFGARYYNPKYSMWQSPDPMLANYMRGQVSGGVLAPANLGLYTYSWNNPVVLRDPTGLGVQTGASGADEPSQVQIQQETSVQALTRAGIREGIDKWGYDPLYASVYGYLKATGQGTTYGDVQGFIVSNLIDHNVPSVGMSQSSAQFADMQLHLAGDAILALTGGIAAEFGVGGSSAAEGVATGSYRQMVRSLGAAGDDLLLNKAVNSNLPHAVARGVERGVFASAEEGAAALRGLTQQITSSGTFPTGTLVDTARAGRFLVPVGNNGLAVYQLGANGTAKLKTVLIGR
jgi:RHS repeat-associated protein